MVHEAIALVRRRACTRSLQHGHGNTSSGAAGGGRGGEKGWITPNVSPTRTAGRFDRTAHGGLQRGDTAASSRGRARWTTTTLPTSHSGHDGLRGRRERSSAHAGRDRTTPGRVPGRRTISRPSLHMGGANPGIAEGDRYRASVPRSLRWRARPEELLPATGAVVAPSGSGRLCTAPRCASHRRATLALRNEGPTLETILRRA